MQNQETLRLMMEADKREQLLTFRICDALDTAMIIEAELEDGEVDPIDHPSVFLAGPNYVPQETPTPEYFVYLNDMIQEGWHRGPEPMLDRG